MRAPHGTGRVACVRRAGQARGMPLDCAAPKGQPGRERTRGVARFFAYAACSLRTRARCMTGVAPASATLRERVSWEVKGGVEGSSGYGWGRVGVARAGEERRRASGVGHFAAGGSFSGTGTSRSYSIDEATGEYRTRASFGARRSRRRLCRERRKMSVREDERVRNSGVMSV